MHANPRTGHLIIIFKIVLIFMPQFGGSHLTGHLTGQEACSSLLLMLDLQNCKPNPIDRALDHEYYYSEILES